MRNQQTRRMMLALTRRPSTFSAMEEMEEERMVFGDECVGVLEPRPRVGWWGLGEVLEAGR